MNWKTILILLIILALIVHFTGILDCKERFIKVDNSKCVDTETKMNTVSINNFDDYHLNKKFINFCMKNNGTIFCYK